MLSKLLFIFVVFFCGTNAQNASPQEKSFRVRNRFALNADKGLVGQFAHKCLGVKSQIGESLTVENLIHLIEKLENEVANKTQLANFNSPEQISRMLLQRFNLDSVDFSNLDQDTLSSSLANINTQVVGLMTHLPSAEYDFPDYLYSELELCTLLYALSHGFNRVLVTPESIEEIGVLKFHKEAIAPARLLTGVVGAFSQSIELSGKAITRKLTGSAMTSDVRLSSASLAVTLGSQQGSASFFDFQGRPSENFDSKLVFGVSGSWTDGRYFLANSTKWNALKFSSRASLAEVRGALDGYALGKGFQRLTSKITLSSGLRLFYSKPQIGRSPSNPLGASYCSRGDLLHQKSLEIKKEGIEYDKIFNFVTSRENSVYKGSLMMDVLAEAAKTSVGFCDWEPSLKKSFKVHCTYEEL